MKKPTLRPAALLLALMLALSLTACGAETPEQVLKTAGDNLNGADSLGYTLEVAMTLTSGGQDLDVSLTADGETTKDPAVTHTAMAIDLGGLMRADMEMYTEQGEDGSVTVFAGMADSSGDVQWSRQTAAVEDPENLTSTAQGAYSFLAGVADIRENGRETIDGVEATRYDAVVTGEAMEALLNATGAMDSLSGSVLNGADPGTLTEDLGDLPVCVWVDPAKKLPVRIAFDMTDLMQSLLEKLTTAGGVDLAVSDTTFTMTFRDIGAVGTIEIPEEARAAE